MFKTDLVGVALVGTMLLTETAAWAAAQDSHAFLTKAIEGNFAEIAMGQLAQQKGGAPEVKAFGKALIEDHTAANEDALAAARTLGVTPPTEPDAAAKEMRDRLAGQSGAAFDRAFTAAMFDGHRKAVAAYQAEANGATDAAGRYALQALPMLKDHLSRAGILANSMRPKISDKEAGLEAGRNSFTESQTRSRLQRAGFSQVAGLIKDMHGVWRGTATKDGQFLSVAMDFRGKIASQ